MKKIILVEQDNILDALFSLNLSTFLGSSVISKKTTIEAIELLQANVDTSTVTAPNANVSTNTNVNTNTIISDFVLIITRNHTANSSISAEQTYNFLYKNNINIPMIIIGNEPPFTLHLNKEKTQNHGEQVSQVNQISIVSEQIDVFDLVKKAVTILGITIKDITGIKDLDYIPIPIQFFLTIDQLICPLYLRLKTSTGDHYIKRFHAEDVVDFKDAERLAKKGVRELYIPKQYKLSFTSNATQQILNKLKSDNINEKDRIILVSNSVDILRENVQLSEITNETIELAQTTIESVKKVISSSAKLKVLLDKIINNKSSYRYKMIQLTSYLSYHVLNNLEWGTKDHQEKLAYVALLHDIVLSKDEHAMIRTEEELSLATDISEQEKSEIKTHAFKASEMISRLPTAPIGTEVIIKQHHGSNGGFGFPLEISDGLSPLATVFLLCEDYSHFLIKNQTSSFGKINAIAPNFLSSKDLFSNLKEKYLNQSLFMRVTRILENLNI